MKNNTNQLSQNTIDIPIFNLTGVKSRVFMAGMLSALIVLEDNNVPHARVLWNEDDKCFQLEYYGQISKYDKKRILVRVAQACPKDAVIDTEDGLF